MRDDRPDLGEQMNRDLYLDPGFTPDRDGLLAELEKDIDETVERAQAAVERRRRAENDAAGSAGDP